MTDSRPLYWARVCLYSAWVFVILSGMILCACPGIPGTGLALAIGSIVLRRGSNVLMPLLTVLVTGILTIAHTQEKIREKGIRAKVEALQRQAATNSASTGPTTTTNRNP